MINRRRRGPSTVSDTGPFAMLPEWVMQECVRLPQGASMLRVFGYLALRADRDHHECFPSVGRMERDLNLSRSTVKRAVGLLAEIGAVTIEGRERDNGSQTSNVYVVHYSRPKNGVYEWGGGFTHEPPGGSTHEPGGGSPMNPPQPEPVESEPPNTEPDVRAPSVQRNDTEDSVPPTRDSGTVDHSKRKRELPTGYIKRKAAPQRGNTYLARQFKERVEVGLQDWVWKLTSSSDGNPSKTNGPALAKFFSTWRAQHGWTDAEGVAVIDTFVSMVTHGYLKVSKQEETLPWRVFVSNIDKVLAHHKKMNGVGQTASGWEDTL